MPKTLAEILIEITFKQSYRIPNYCIVLFAVQVYITQIIKGLE